MDPFRYGQVVKGEHFCPRPELSKILADHIQAGQNVYVQGERRIGKTSLISEAVAGLPHKLIYLDLLGVKSVDMLTRQIAVAALAVSESSTNILERAAKYLAQLGLTFSFDPTTYAPTLSVGHRGGTASLPESIEAAIDLIGSVHTAKRPVVVVLDEFQSILGVKQHEELVARMRSRIQFQAEIPYVFAGSVRSQMDGLFVSPDSPFFKSAVQVFVGALDPPTFRKYLLARFKSGNREISEEILVMVMRICDGVTGDVQQFCSALWSVTDEDSRITEASIPDALQVIFGRERAGYEAAIESITEHQMKCLLGIARYGGKETTGLDFLQKTGLPLPASAQKALARLVNTRILFRVGTEYRFANPFFREWLGRIGGAP